MSDSNLTNNDIKFIASKLSFKPSQTIKILFIFTILQIYNNSNKKRKFLRLTQLS